MMMVVPRESICCRSGSRLVALWAAALLLLLVATSAAAAVSAPAVGGFDFAAAATADSGEGGSNGGRDDDDDFENRSNDAAHHHQHHNQHHSHHHQQQQQQQQQAAREVRCYCNLPDCVSQGNTCRGRSCYTELPVVGYAAPAERLADQLRRHEEQQRRLEQLDPLLRQLTRQQQRQQQQQQLQQLQQHKVHASYSGCLELSLSEKPCSSGKLCCEQDLCNHVDNPVMRSRLNKTIQVLLGEHSRTYFGPVPPQLPPAASPELQSSDGWFKAATIAVPICGFVVLLVLALLAMRLLQPVPSQSDKLHGFGLPEHAPPLLGPRKLLLV